MGSRVLPFSGARSIYALFAALAGLVTSCGGVPTPAQANGSPAPCREVSAVKAGAKDLQQQLTISSELVPFQQIDLFAKESGFIRKLNVDYGSHVKAGDILAILEIPELQSQLEEDDADIADEAGQVSRAQKELDRVKAERDVRHLEYVRLNSVAKGKPGLVAQQEVDDAHGRDLSSEAQVQAAESTLQSAISLHTRALAKRRRDQVIFDYSKIIAPFDGVVTQRYANLGALMQSGINSSTQAMPLVQLSEDDLFRLVIPVPESYVRYIRVGDPVKVRIPSLNQDFPGRVKRFSVDVRSDTRTMHTEVDVPNPRRVLMPGLYAEATLTIDNRSRVTAIPLEAVNVDGYRRAVFVVNGSNRIEARNVTLGMETPDEAEVVSGVKEGEWVVMGGRGSLEPGEAVCPKEAHLLRYRGD